MQQAVDFRKVAAAADCRNSISEGRNVMKSRVQHREGVLSLPPTMTSNSSHSGSCGSFLTVLALVAALGPARPCRADAFDVRPEQLVLSSSHPTATFVIRNDSDGVMKLRLNLF
jgi:hypothetical protein